MRVPKSLVGACFVHPICLLLAAFSGFTATSAYATDFTQNLKSGTPLIVAQAATPRSAKVPSQASPVAPNSSGADIVSKLLSNPPSDPDVPLPRGDLAARPATEGGLERPTIYGRQEDGGGVFGLRIPIPADRQAR